MGGPGDCRPAIVLQPSGLEGMPLGAPALGVLTSNRLMLLAVMVSIMTCSMPVVRVPPLRFARFLAQRPPPQADAPCANQRMRADAPK